MQRVLKPFAAALALALAVPAFAAKNDALSLVPANAVTVGVVKLRDMRNSPLSSTLFQQTDKFSADGDAARFLADAGLQPSKDVDVLVVATIPRTNLGREADVLIAADGRFNADRLTSALLARGAVKREGYLLMPEETADSDHERGAVAFPDAHLALIGTEHAVTSALAARAAGGTSFFTTSILANAAARIDASATAWAIVDVTRAARLAGGPHVASGKGQPADALAAAIKNVSTVAVWATDTGDSLKLGGFGLTNDAETLQLLEDTVRGALAAMRLAVKDKAPEMVSILRKFDVSRSNDAVMITGTIPAATLKDLIVKQHASK